MSRTVRKYLLGCYLAVTVTGIVLYRAFGHQIWELLPAADAAEQPLSWSMVPGMGVFMLLFALTVFFSAPTNPLFYLAAGYLYGAVPGAVIASLATTLGSGAAFQFFRKTITPPPSFQRPEVGNLHFVLVLLRCSPWFPSPLINLFCGVIRVRPALFAVSTLFGTMPLVGVYTITASRLRGPLDISLLHSPELITALAVLGAVSLLGFLQPLRIVASHLRALAVSLARPADNHS